MPPDILEMILEGQRQIKADLDAHRQESKERHEAMSHTIHGNGKPGLVVDVDRLKERVKKSDWWSKIAVVAVMGQLAILIRMALEKTL